MKTDIETSSTGEKWLVGVALLLALPALLSVAVAHAQGYPVKPVRIVTAGVGGGNDMVSRLIAQGISGPLGQTVYVENRGGGFAAGEVAARAAPDGHTLLVMSGGLWIGQLVRRKVPYDVQRDFAPVTLADRAPNILVVHPSLPVHSVRDLISLARARPGMLNYSSAGTASSSHLSGELFKSMAKVDMVNIQYKNNSQETIDLVSGQMHLAFATASAVHQHVKDGRLRAIAVTSARPSPLAPGLPTVAAGGLPGYESESVHAVFAPARTPEPVLRRLNQEIVKFLHSPDAKSHLLNAGVEAVGGSAEELAVLLRADIAKWSRIIQQAGLREE